MAKQDGENRSLVCRFLSPLRNAPQSASSARINERPFVSLIVAGRAIVESPDFSGQPAPLLIALGDGLQHGGDGAPARSRFEPPHVAHAPNPVKKYCDRTPRPSRT